MKRLLFVSVFSLLAVAAGAALFPLNSKLPYTVGVDTDGRNRFLGTIADLQIELGGKVFHQGPAQVGDRLAEKPAAADLERPLKFSCRFTTRELRRPQRLLDNAHAGAADGIMFDICMGRLRFMPGNDHAHLYHPTPIPSNREVEVSVEVTADHKVMMSVDGDRRLCGQLVDGRLVQELSGFSSSPEVDDNRLSCFFTTNTNYARSILNAFYIRLARLAEFLGERNEAAKWRSYVGTFGPVSARNGVLEIAKGRLLTYSHRHASHLMDVFPFYDTPRDAEVDPVKSVDQFERLGSRHWAGFSFSWEGCLNARLGRGDRAWMYLKEFQTLCASRNGFNLNNQIPAGPILHTGRPFTLDANFGFARAVQEMLLQHDPRDEFKEKMQ